MSDKLTWNDDVKHLAQLYNEAYENTSDEEAEPFARNPMGLIEWLRRNQPSVFTSETTVDLKKTIAEKLLAGGASGVGTAAGAEKTPTKKRKPADPSSAVKPGRKRKATTQEETVSEGGVSGSADNTVANTKRVKKEE